MLSPHHVCLLIALTLSIVSSASAQVQTGTITGVVIDQQNAVLPGVTVTVNSDALIRPQTTVTNERGVFSVIALPPGIYRVKFELQGFAPIDRSDIPVRVAVVTTVDQTMQVASVTESVIVTGRPRGHDSILDGFVKPQLRSGPSWPRVQGVVILECTISPQGKVTNVTVLRGIPLLDASAIEAVKQWVYTPTLLNGVPVPVIMTVTVNFRLS